MRNTKESVMGKDIMFIMGLIISLSYYFYYDKVENELIKHEYIWKDYFIYTLILAAPLILDFAILDITNKYLKVKSKFIRSVYNLNFFLCILNSLVLILNSPPHSHFSFS